LKLSIITVNFNNCEGLAKTIQSVFAQDFADMEYIAIDAGSTDGSKELLEAAGSRLDYWVSEPDSGIYNGMNKGIRQASGEYLLFLNSGDYLSDGNVLQDIFSEPHSADILYGDLYINTASINNLHKFPENLSLAYMLYGTIGHPSTFFKKRLFDEIGLYDEQYKIVSDWKFLMQAIILRRCTLEHLHMPVSVFVLDGVSSKPGAQEKINNERESIKREILTHFQVDFPMFDSNFRKSSLANFYNQASKGTMQRKLVRKLLGTLLQGKIKYDLVKETFGRNSIKRNKRKLNSKFTNPKEIPIVINNFNRLDCLKELLSSLESRGYQNLIILDNASSYPPLLEFYASCPYRLIKLKKNVGHLAIWETEEGKEFLGDYYVYTDPDVVPVESCPDNFLEYFAGILKLYPEVDKVGFSLKIDDLPEFYHKKTQVIEWEKQNYAKNISVGLYDASIDTTFALYRPGGHGDWKSKAIRTAAPYEARHLPWYVDEDALSAEELYYRKTRKQEVSQWT
jgi:glycosyltransferase involved in cell wall biosynthesis